MSPLWEVTLILVINICNARAAIYAAYLQFQMLCILKADTIFPSSELYFVLRPKERGKLFSVMRFQENNNFKEESIEKCGEANKTF